MQRLFTNDKCVVLSRRSYWQSVDLVKPFSSIRSLDSLSHNLYLKILTKFQSSQARAFVGLSYDYTTLNLLLAAVRRREAVFACLAISKLLASWNQLINVQP